jgi:hypothetical protein
VSRAFRRAVRALPLALCLHSACDRGARRAEEPAPEAGRVAVRLATAEAAEIRSERAGFARVVDPLPFVDYVGARSAAQRTFELAEIERRRVEGLQAHDRNASQREVEAARLAAARAAVDLRSATARMVAVWGAGAAGRADLDALAERLASGAVSIVRVDLPAGAPGTRLDDLRIATTGRAGSSLETVPLGPAPVADTLTQGLGYLLLVERDAPPTGTVLAARIESTPTRGTFVPESAVVWAAGEPAVFIASPGGTFERRTVSRLGSLPGGWLVGSEIAAGEQIVVHGAQQLLSREILAASNED